MTPPLALQMMSFAQAEVTMSPRHAKANVSLCFCRSFKYFCFMKGIVWTAMQARSI